VFIRIRPPENIRIFVFGRILKRSIQHNCISTFSLKPVSSLGGAQAAENIHPRPTPFDSGASTLYWNLRPAFVFRLVKIPYTIVDGHNGVYDATPATYHTRPHKMAAAAAVYRMTSLSPRA